MFFKASVAYELFANYCQRINVLKLIVECLDIIHKYKKEA